MFSTKLTWYDMVIFSSAAHFAEPPPACRLADFLGIVGIKQMLHDSSQIQMSTIFSECLVSFHILNHHNMIESDFTDRSISKLHCLAEAILLWLGVISSNNTSNKWPKPTNGPTNPENFPAPCHIRLPCNVSCASASAAETKKSTQDSKMKHIGMVQNCGCEFTVFLIYFALYGIQYGIHMNHWAQVKRGVPQIIKEKPSFRGEKNLDARCLWGNQGPKNLATHEKHDITESHCSICWGAKSERPAWVMSRTKRKVHDV